MWSAACLQAGSALSSGGSDRLTRVPAGLDALSIAPSSGVCRQGGKFAASAALVSGSSSGAVQCSYRLAAMEAAYCSMHLGGMLFKPLSSAARVAAVATSAATRSKVDNDQLLYAVIWEASSIAPASISCGAALQHNLHWSIGGRTALCAHTGNDAGGFGALQSSLALLQAATSSRARPSVLLSSQLQSSGIVPGSPAQAAVSGLLRVAARESSGQQFAHILHHTCATQALQLPLDSTDLFGVGLAGKLGGGVDVPAALLLRLESVAV